MIQHIKIIYCFLHLTIATYKHKNKSEIPSWKGIIDIHCKNESGNVYQWAHNEALVYKSYFYFRKVAKLKEESDWRTKGDKGNTAINVSLSLAQMPWLTASTFC